MGNIRITIAGDVGHWNVSSGGTGGGMGWYFDSPLASTVQLALPCRKHNPKSMDSFAELMSIRLISIGCIDDTPSS